MSMGKKGTAVLTAAVLAAWGLCGAGAQGPPAGPGTLVVVDGAGKEQTLKTWKFLAGTRRLSWLAPDADKGAEQPPAGPEALEFRGELDIKYLEGIVTLIPLERLRSLDFDNDKETVTARVAGPAQDADVTLTGTTKYRRINKVILEAEVDKGDLGVAEIKYLGGVPKGIRAVRCPAARPAPAAPGRPAVVTGEDGTKKSAHPVTDLQALYRLANGERLLPTLFFKKTLKLDVSKIARIVAAPGGDSDDGSWQVVLKDGQDETLTLLREVQVDGRQAVLEGLLGRVPAGYQLFPVPSVVEVKFDATEAEPRPADAGK